MADKGAFVVLEKRGDFAVLRWNRPSKQNAINPEMQIAFTKHLKDLADDEKIKLVLITGTGQYYTRGADVIRLNESKTEIYVDEKASDAFRNLVDCLIDFPKPIIAAVNGPAVGMGVSTLPLFDVVYASSDSTFIAPFSKIGLVPEACSSYTFPMIMGYAKANEMLLFNRLISASEASSCGLVAEVFPKDSLMKEVYKRVHDFVENPVKSLIYGKRLIRGVDKKKLHQLNNDESERLIERASSEDMKTQAWKYIKGEISLTS